MKLIRAQEHLGTLNAEFASYTESEPYRIVRELDDEDNPTLVTIRLNQWTAPTARWSVMIGDVLHNLRSALDHLAWQLVKINDGAPGRGTQFPIYADRILVKPDGTEVVRDITIAGGITPEAAALLESLQPYNRVEDPTLDPLFILNKLSNQDKHRTLNVYLPWVAVAVSKVQTGFLEALVPPRIHPGPFFHNSVIGEWPYPTGMNVQVELTPLVSIPITWATDESGQVVDLLAYLLEFVREGVIEPFARTCF